MTKPIVGSSDAHVLLMFARSLQKPFSIGDIREMSPTRFTDNRKVKRCIDRLSSFGFVREANKDKWIITNVGLDALYILGRP